MKQPTAIAFTRTQEKFAKHILEKTQEKIDRLEAEMSDPDNPSEELLDLYDEELFWGRYVRQMRDQRDYLHGKFGIEY